MFKKISIVLGIGIVMVLAGCASVSTTVIPQANHQYQVIAMAKDSSHSVHGAISKATEVCKNENKSLVVVSNKTKYQGSGKQLGMLTSIAHTAAFMNSDSVFIPSTKTNTDYKTVITFECR